MSAAVLVLPRVWASVPVQVEAREEAVCTPLRPELAFYRKYTEAMLRRFVSMSMEAGRVPSLLGKEMFHARVTNYVVRSFEDVVIFVHDVEKCIAKLDSEQQMLIRRIGVQQYSQADVAGMQGQTDTNGDSAVQRGAGSVDADVSFGQVAGAAEYCQGAGSAKIALTS